MRICSLLPSATEIAFALGLGDSIVGVTHECDYPPEATKIPSVVKSAIDPDKTSSGKIDRIVGEHLQTKKSIYEIDLPRFKAADPDLILTQELCDVCAVDYQEVLKAARTLQKEPTIVSLAPSLLFDVLRDIERVGQATGRSSDAEDFVMILKGRIELVRELAHQSIQRPRVVCLEWLEPIYSPGHWVPEMVELAAGREMLGKKGEPSMKSDWESVLQFAPEVIVLMPCGFNIERILKEVHLLYQLPGWDELPAVKENRVFAVNGHAYFNRSGPRLIDGLEILGQIIHPEIFTWKAPPEAARRLN